MDVKLTIYDDKRQIFSQVVSLPCVVGRSKHCNIAIVHPLISRQHCEIFDDGGFVKARDLGSLNGTFYRGERVGRGVVIPFGDAFSIGALYFLIETASPETTKLVVPSTDENERSAIKNPADFTTAKAQKKSTQSDILLTSQSSESDSLYQLAADELHADASKDPKKTLDDSNRDLNFNDRSDGGSEPRELLDPVDDVLDLADFLDDDSSAG